MTLRYWVVDAFADAPFKGNPAAVIILDTDLPADVMQSIAAEINLSETAFVLKTADGFHLRWFTPGCEVDLCGHATLSAAHIYLTEIAPELTAISFTTNVAGVLSVEKQGDLYEMDFPARPGEKLDITNVPALVTDSLGNAAVKEAYLARDLMLVYETEAEVRTIQPNYFQLNPYEHWVIITAPADAGKPYDFVSRFFCAGDGIEEDPVTGSTHCTLIPYWSNRLGKAEMTAYQASARGGTLYCQNRGERVSIKGKALTVMEGAFRIALHS